MPGDRLAGRHVANRTWARFRSRGPGEVGRLAIDRFKEAVESGDSLVVFTLAARVEPTSSDDLLFRFATPEDGDAYARDIGTDSPRSFRARLSPTTSCFVIEAKGRLLHSSWVTTSGAWTRELRSYLSPPRRGAYIYESFTRTDARGRGLYPSALRGIASDAFERGLDSLWVAVEAGNHSSLRAVSKVGFIPVSRLDYRRRWGRMTLRIPTAGERGRDGLRIERT